MIGLGGMCACAVIMTAALALLVSLARMPELCVGGELSVNFCVLLIGQCSLDELH